MFRISYREAGNLVNQMVEILDELSTSSSRRLYSSIPFSSGYREVLDNVFLVTSRFDALEEHIEEALKVKYVGMGLYLVT